MATMLDISQDDTMVFTFFDFKMAFIIPFVCVTFPCITAIMNYVHHQDAMPPAKDMENEIDSKDVEVPGDMVQMYVELEADEEIGRERRAQASELDGRGLGEARTV